MKIISIDASNIDGEHICCSIGNDTESQRRALGKKAWLKDRFADGLKFKRLDARGKVFVEYMPIEKVWKPLVGRNFMVINCLWVSGQFKGMGFSKQLLAECIADARVQKMDGVAVVTSNKVKPFLTDKKFYLKHGFQPVDTAPPYFELLVLKFNEAAENPRFAEHAKSGECDFPPGFTFVFSNQCPFTEDFAGFYVEIAQKHGFEARAIHLKNSGEAQRLGSPFGTFGVYFDGKIQFHELPTEGKFEEFALSKKQGRASVV